MKRRVVLWLKTQGINWSCSASNWVCDHICYADINRPVGWVDHLRWWIEARLAWIFQISYEGSNEEVRDGIEHALDGTKWEYLTPNQQEIKLRLSEFIDTEVQS